MRFRGRQERPEPIVPALAAAARANLQRQYVEGLRDGVLSALDHIEGKPDAGGAPYTGPLPDELRDYLRNVRLAATLGTEGDLARPGEG